MLAGWFAGETAYSVVNDKMDKFIRVGVGGTNCKFWGKKKPLKFV